MPLKLIPNRDRAQARPNTIFFEEGGKRLQNYSRAPGFPLITIITVVYNNLASLIHTVQNVAALKRPDVQYLVVDGSSNDGTLEYLRASNDIIDYWISENDNGIYSAMNKAIEFVESESFVYFLGAGDVILELPNKETIDFANGLGIDVLFGDVKIGKALFRSEISNKLIYRNTLHHQGMFVRYGAVSVPWFDELNKAFSDWELNISLFRRGARFHRIDLVVAQVEAGGASSKLYIAEVAKISARNFGILPASFAIFYHLITYLYRRYDRFSEYTI